MMSEFLTNGCPACGKNLAVADRNTFGTSNCPNCDAKLWFVAYGQSASFFDFESSRQFRLQLRGFLANQPSVIPTKFPSDLSGITLDDLGLDSLDTIELLMELEEESGYNPPEDDDQVAPAV